MTDRYTKAIEQLGSEKLDVRIGSIYALERVARDSPRDHPTVMEVLAALIRVHSHEQWPPPEPGNDAMPLRTTRPDVQAAVTIIGRRDSNGDRRRIDLTRADLSRADLSYADLNYADLTDADLNYAHFRDAHLNGAWLGGAHVNDAYLGGAHLNEAGLQRAHLNHAHLIGAHLDHAYLGSAVQRRAPQRRAERAAVALAREIRASSVAVTLAAMEDVPTRGPGTIRPEISSNGVRW